MCYTFNSDRDEKGCAMMIRGNLALKDEYCTGRCFSSGYNNNPKPYRDLNRSFLSTYEKGISAERIVAKKLENEGYEILGQRIRTGYGEIDLLIKKGNDIVAIEVKQRKTLSEAKCCISFRQQKRIVNALLFIASQRKKPFENYRIDVVCLDAVGRFEHIENAFSVETLVAC